MKRIIKVISISLALVTACSAFAFAAGDGTSKVGKPALKVKKRTSKVTMNGVASEKAWKKSKSTSIKPNAFTWGLDADMSAGKSKSMSTRGNVASIPACKLLWDKKGIYCYIKVADKTPCDDKFTSINTCDSVEYHFDMKNKKATAYMGKNDVQYCFSRTGNVGSFGEANMNGFKSSKNSKTKNFKTKGYSQEVYIRCDWHDVASFKKGNRVGFDLQINDGYKKNATVIRRHIVWNSIDNAWTNPATMGTLVLS